MAHFALLWKARTIEKYRQNYENQKYISVQKTNTPMPQKSLSQRLRCYRQDTQKRFSKIFQKLYPEGSSLSNFFLYLRTDQACLYFVLKSLLGFLTGLGLTYLCFLFLVFQLSISLFHATIVSSIIGVLLTMSLAFSYRIRCLVFLLLPQFFSRAGRYTLTCYALVLILTGPATNTLKNSEVLTESMACRQEEIKSLVYEVKQTMRKPLNSMRETIKIMVQKLHLFTRNLKITLLKVNRLSLSVLETIQSTFSWLQWLSEVCNRKMGSPYERCIKSFGDRTFDYKGKYKPNNEKAKRQPIKAEEICSNVKKYKATCFFTDFVNGSFVASIKRRLKEFSQRIREMLYLQIHVHHSYSFPSNTSHSASQVAAGIVTEIRKRADPLLTWLSWSSCVTSLFLLLIIFRAKYYQHMFETRSRFDNKYITKEIRDLDLNRLRHGRETILPLNKRERSKYVSTTSFRLAASEKIHLNRSIVFMTITTFKLLIHMVADYSLYWVLMTIQYHGKNQSPLPYGVPNAGMHISGKGRVADMFRDLLMALTAPLEISHPLPTNCLPDPKPPDLQRYTQIGILIFLLWFFSLFEPYGLRLRHVVMGLYRPERAKARAEWLYNHILRTRGGFMKFARRKLHRTYKCYSERYTFKRWLSDHIPFCWLRFLLRISTQEIHCLLCGSNKISKNLHTKLRKCDTPNCPGTYCSNCFSDLGELCTICISPSDYGDLSDVSLEKGSSGESDDDFYETSVDKRMNEDIFESESDDILLPRPMRSHYNKASRSVSKNNNSKKTNKMNDIGNTHRKSYKTLPDLLSKHIKLRKGYCLINNKLPKKHKRRDNEKREQNTDNNSKTLHNKTTNSKNNLADKKVNENKNDKENKSGGSDELNLGDKKEINKRKNNGDRDEILRSKSSFNSWRCFKQLSTLAYACWVDIKRTLSISSNQAIDNNTLCYEKNNFKTRKKDILDIGKKNNRRIEHENSRQYRIFAYLAEQDWVLKNSTIYNCARIEKSTSSMKPDADTVEKLKHDLFSQRTVHLPDKNDKPDLIRHTMICKDCKYPCFCPGNPIRHLLDFQTKGDTKNIETSNIDTVNPNTNGNYSYIQRFSDNKLKSKKPRKVQRLLRCLKCKCWSKKRKTSVDSKIKSEKQATAPPTTKINKKNNTKTLKDSSSELKDNGNVRNKKYKFISNKAKRDSRDTYEKLNKKNKRKNRSTQYQEKVFTNKHENRFNKGKSDAKLSLNKMNKTKCYKDRSTQYQEKVFRNEKKTLVKPLKSDKPSKLIKEVTDKEGCHEKSHIEKKTEKECKINQRSCTKGQGDAESFNDHKIDEKCDALCTDDCKCNKKGIIIEKCDPLCPDNCECNNEGIIVEKCDPLCPDECNCKKQGIIVEKCDLLCPKECSCNNQGIIVEKCDPLCPDDCSCNGCGVVIDKCNAQRSHECCCKADDKMCCSNDKEGDHKQIIVKNYPATLNKAASKNSNNKSKQKNCIHKNKSHNCKDKVKCDNGTDIDIRYSSDYILCDYNEYLTPDENFCTCAIQCPSLEYASDSCEEEYCTGSQVYSCPLCSSNTSIDSDGQRSDYTGTDTTIGHVYVEKPRRRRARLTLVAKCHRCTGTDEPMTANVGTITNERGLVGKIIYVPRNERKICVQDRRYKKNRGVSTKKLVTFKTAVQLIPSKYGVPDIYTPSRYLLESQKYYNELFATANIYPINIIQGLSHRRISHGSRSHYSAKVRRQAKKHVTGPNIQRKKLSRPRAGSINKERKYRKSIRIFIPNNFY